VGSSVINMARGGNRLLPLSIPDFKLENREHDGYDELLDILRTNSKLIPDTVGEEINIVGMELYLKFYNYLQLKKWHFFFEFVNELNNEAITFAFIPFPNNKMIKGLVEEEIKASVNEQFMDLLVGISKKVSKEDYDYDWDDTLKHYENIKRDLQSYQETYGRLFGIEIEKKIESSKIDAIKNKLKGVVNENVDARFQGLFYDILFE